MSQQTLREKVSREIRNKIIRQDLKPGERIIEQDLAAEFQTSRGPIREALRDLENEGLIEYTRNVGCTVKKMNVEDSYEIYLMRAAYEIMAVRMMKGKIPESTIAALEEILSGMENLAMDQYEKIIEFDNAFHEALVLMPNLRRLHRSWQTFSYANIATGFSENLNKEKRLHHQYPSHKSIIDLCKNQDTKGICKEISEHYWRTISRIMDEESVEESRRKEYWGYIFENTEMPMA